MARPFLPRAALEYLWVVWGTGALTGEAFWARFEERYGFVRVENRTLPLGIDDAGGGAVSLNCLVCHVDRVAGRVTVGAGNSRVDIQGLFDDLVALNNRSPMPVPLPFELRSKTGAAGATDAFGLGMELSTHYQPGAPSINTTYGYQQAPALWNMRYKGRIYTDGSGQTHGYRTMMATLLAFGMSFSELQSYDKEFSDLHQYLLSLEAPEWPFAPPEPSEVELGRGVFNEHCAECHGVYGGSTARYSDTRTPISDIGTDALRADQFGADEAAWVNGSWFGNVPMESTKAYLAPPLVGVWATAPYFHNGSVPDLLGVLDSEQRPLRWRRMGSSAEHYDQRRVGWRFEVQDTAGDPVSIEGRRIYDTARPGLSSAGHTFGDALTATEREALLSFLKQL